MKEFNILSSQWGKGKPKDSIIIIDVSVVKDHHYGGILVCESVRSEELRDHIIDLHNKFLGKTEVPGPTEPKCEPPFTESDRDNLCDMLWWLRGYKKGANDQFEECPFGEDHLKTLENVVHFMRDVLNKKS